MNGITLANARETSARVEVSGRTEFVVPEIQDETNAMIVGPAQRGPVFVPTEVRTVDEFDSIFGGPTTYSAYSAREVLRQTDRINFTRIIATDGWDPTTVSIRGRAGVDWPNVDSEAGNLLALLIFSDRYQRVKGADPQKTRILSPTASRQALAQRFTLQTFAEDDDPENDTPLDEFVLSLNPRSPRYITKVLPPQIRIYQNFPERQREIIEDVTTRALVNLIISNGDDTNPLTFPTFDSPRTPWIESQLLPGGDRIELFRLWVRGDGETENRRFKVSITDVGSPFSESGWPTFTINLRDFDDTDFNQDIIESFENLSLNPEDENFIGSAIGTKYSSYNFNARRVESFGDFDPQSLDIRVELSDDLVAADSDILPFGFGSYQRTFLNSSQTPIYRSEQRFGALSDYLELGSVDAGPGRGANLTDQLHFGIEFREDQNNNIFQGIPEGSEPMDDGFYLDRDADVDPNNSSIIERKFSLGFQGGTDGQSVYREVFVGEDIRPENTFGFNFDGANSGGQEAYRRAYELLREPRAGVGFNLLTTPELDFQNHERLIRQADELVRDRGDAVYIFDTFELGDNPEDVNILTLNSSYSATYFGWVEEDVTEFDLVPSSAVIPQTFALSDSNTAPWFAASGVDRGQVPNVIDVNLRLNRNQLDFLQEQNVNAVSFFDDEGVLLWGNLTTLEDSRGSTPRELLNVRRLIASLVSRVRDEAQNFLFEQVTPELVQDFRVEILDILGGIQSRSGLTDFEVEVSPVSNNGVTERAPNRLDVQISFSPVGVIEVISLDFVIERERFSIAE